MVSLKLKGAKYPVKARLQRLDTPVGLEYPYPASQPELAEYPAGQLPGEHVPNTKSAVKRQRQNLRRHSRNKAARSELKTAVKKVRSADEPQNATEAFRQAARMLDQAASKGLIHKNQAARSKERLAKHVQKLGGTI